MDGLTKLSKVSLSEYRDSYFEVWEVLRETPKTYKMTRMYYGGQQESVVRKSEIGKVSYHNVWVPVGSEQDAILQFHKNRVKIQLEKIEYAQGYLDFHKEQIEKCMSSTEK